MSPEDELIFVKAQLKESEARLEVSERLVKEHYAKQLAARLKLDAHLQRCRAMFDETELPKEERVALLTLLDDIERKLRDYDRQDFEQSWGE